MNALPDELILHIMRFMNPASVGRCRLVNRQLSRLAYDKVLLRKFPYYMFEGEVFLKEEAYFSEWTFLELMKRDKNDLDWLVARTTDIIRDCQMDSTTWFILISGIKDAAFQYIYIYFCSDAARDAGRDYTPVAAAYEASQGSALCAASGYVFRYGTWRGNMHSKWRHTIYAASNILGNMFNIDDNTNQIKLLGITDPKCIGVKCYQIMECKYLLAIDKKMCLQIMELMEKTPLPESPHIPKGDIPKFSGNPWIQQYAALYDT